MKITVAVAWDWREEAESIITRAAKDADAEQVRAIIDVLSAEAADRGRHSELLGKLDSNGTTVEELERFIKDARKAFADGVIGWGRFRAEVPEHNVGRTFRTVKGEGSWNPLAGALDGKSQFRLTTANREAGARVEDMMRGALMFKVARRARAQGRTTAQALQEAYDAIDRLHFSYHDLSDFERKVKGVIPFYDTTPRLNAGRPWLSPRGG